MITREQIDLLAKKNKINSSTIFREYLQLLFLNELYSQNESRSIFFKGGTALHLIYKLPRFSEDLDFTVMMDNEEFSVFINKVFTQFEKRETVSFKEKKTIAGRSFLLKASPSILPYETFVRLDFSFREKVLRPEKSIIETEYPVLFTTYIYHLSKEEIFAEKIRAVLSRKKGRDLYDLWYLINQGVKSDDDLIREKIKYYGLKKIEKGEIITALPKPRNLLRAMKAKPGFKLPRKLIVKRLKAYQRKPWAFSPGKLIKRINDFSEKDFVLDLRPFVPVNEREKLNQFFTYLKDYLRKKL